MENPITSTTNAFLARSRSRTEFLKTIAAGGLAAVAGSSFLAGEADAQALSSDVDLLNAFLPVEIFESQVFYPAALEAGILSGDALIVVQQLVAVEAVHRDALIATIQSLGGTPAPPPEFVIPPGILTDQTTFLQVALQQEITDVGGNLGAAPLIQSPDVLAAAAAIEGQEGENVSTLKNLLGVVPPANDPFPQALSLDQVLAEFSQFIAAPPPSAEVPPAGTAGASAGIY